MIIRSVVLACFIGLIVGCSSSSVKPEPQTVSLNNDTLIKLGITAASPAPQYPFEEFYKTSQISGFEFKSDKSGVYFLKKDAKVENVFEYNFANRKIKQITFFPETVSSFLVDPKGKYLIIQKDIGGSELYDLYRFDLKTKKVKRLTDGKNEERNFACDLTKDGRKLYFAQSREKRNYSDIMSYDLVSDKIETVLKANKEQLYCSTLNKKNNLLGFTKFIDNNEVHLGLLDLDTGKYKYILNEKGIKSSDGVFADNTDNIYFLSTKGSDLFRLWVYNTKSELVELAKTDISNSIEGVGIYGSGSVSVVRYRGELAPKVKVYSGVLEAELKLPIAPENIKNAMFDKEDPKLGIIIAQNGAAPKQYYVLNHDKLDLLYNSNQSSIKDEHFSKSSSLFVNSFDGLKVPAHYFIPNGTSSTNKKPVVFWIHGGPEDNVDPEFSSVIQYILNQGFIVVAPNVRGSTGFGKAYQFKDNGDWGGGHIKDIVAVAEFTRGLDFVDSQNIFVLGGSFGGFSVMSLITQYPKVFKAAVDIFGPVEFASFVNSWPPQVQPYWITELGFDPRLDKAKNEKVSPLYHVQNISIPLQVHQGANDIRVPKAQSDLLVSEIKKAGKDVDYFVYDSEGHGFTKFENSKLCFTRITDFFRKQSNKQ